MRGNCATGENKVSYFIFLDHVTLHGSDAGCSKEFSEASGSKTPATFIIFYN